MKLDKHTSLNRRSKCEDELVQVSLKTLLDLARPAAGLVQTKSHIRADLGGGYLSRFKGRGMEFDETRLYQAGDDLRTIDWKVTARSGKAHTKIFREERERPVFISVDDRATMHFATRGVFKSVQAAKLAGLLAWIAEQHGDRIGGQIFSERMCEELKPHNGKQAVLRFLYALTSRTKLDQENSFAFEQILARLVKHARPGSLVYIISDFRGLNDAAEKHLAKLAEHCEVQFILVFDALERMLPEKGRYRFTDGEREVVIDSGEIARIADYRQHFEQRLQRLQQIVRKKSLKLILCGTADDPVKHLRKSTHG
jgi:uncharacterized protein (DUF58 family)